jgi:hypothetical protein
MVTHHVKARNETSVGLKTRPEPVDHLAAGTLKTSRVVWP